MTKFDAPVFKIVDGYYEMQEPYLTQYRNELQWQMDNWLQNKFVHTRTEHLPPSVTQECLPDCSCCDSTLAWPLDLRQQFAQATQEQREKMMLENLAKSMLRVVCNDSKH